MPWAELLTEPEITAALGSLPEWRRDGETLVRTVRCDTFRAAIVLVDRVADAAEAADHHPDMAINWKRVTFSLSTKASHGLTWRDLAMAATIDRLGGPVESDPA
jgi:4a-hydroxytetrahydrobiopterin dehydratase